LEKDKAKTLAETLPIPDPRPTPKAQVLLNQEQQKKKKLQQQTLEKQLKPQQEVPVPPLTSQLEKKKKALRDQAQNQPRQPAPASAKTSGASPLAKPTQAVSAKATTASDKQVLASKQVIAPPPSTRAHDQLSEIISRARISGQVLPNLRTPNGDNLGSAEEYVKAWNDADLAEGFSTSAPHPAGPSRMFQSLHAVQTSVADSQRVLEVTLTAIAFTSL